jgi:hypothetical protein
MEITDPLSTLSTRTVNCLCSGVYFARWQPSDTREVARRKLATLFATGQLRRIDDLLKLKNFGSRSLAEFLAWLGPPLPSIADHHNDTAGLIADLYRLRTSFALALENIDTALRHLEGEHGRQVQELIRPEELIPSE